MTYNRPDCVLNAIESVRKQTFTDFTLIVSDNSTNRLTEELIKERYPSPDFVYIKREPSVGGIEHLNLVLSEVASDYFMIFHDDDVMHVNMVETLYNKILEDESYVAVASNAYKVNLAKNTKALFNKTKQDVCISETRDMCVRYLTGNILPFPSYMYRSKRLGNERFERSEGGKHCDSTFLIKLLKRGTILYVSKPLMNYNEHSGQDSFFWSFTEMNAQIQFIIKHLNISRKDRLALNYRIHNIYCELSYQGIAKLTCKSFLKYVFLFFKYSPFYLFPRFLLKRILKM